MRRSLQRLPFNRRPSLHIDRRKFDCLLLERAKWCRRFLLCLLLFLLSLLLSLSFHCLRTQLERHAWLKLKPGSF
jgi:hypothetical protein